VRALEDRDGQGGAAPPPGLVFHCSSLDPAGGFVAAASPIVAADDRGLRYGDGLFESIRVHRGVLPFQDRHLARLRDGLRRLEFPVLGLSDGEIAAILRETARRNGVREGFVRLAVSRTGGARGFLPPDRPGWRLVAEAGALDLARTAAPLRCTVAPWRVDPAYPGAGVKSSSALDKVLAARQAHAAGADEALLLNLRDELVEASGSNVFLVAKGAVRTPALASGALPGIARRVVIDALRSAGVDVSEEALTAADALAAREMFLTNAVRGVLAVASFLEHAYAGAPGPVTRKAERLYRRALDGRVREG